MKKILLFSIILLNLVTYSQNKPIKIVNTEVLNVREKPSKDSKVKDKLYKEQRVSVSDSIGNWLEVTYSTGYDQFSSGFVHKNYISILSKNKHVKSKNMSFKERLKNYAIGTLIVVFMCLSGFHKLTNSIKDDRYRDGKRYNQDSFTVIKLLIYTVLISIPVLLIIALILYYKYG